MGTARLLRLRKRGISLDKLLPRCERLIDKLKHFVDAASVERVKHYQEQCEEIKSLLTDGDKAPTGRTSVIAKQPARRRLTPLQAFPCV